jgi:hypothetical protein
MADPRMQAALGRFMENTGPAITNLERLLAETSK